jgi:5-(carboxyamino)imidazole ribonucleotide synthase
VRLGAIGVLGVRLRPGSTGPQVVGYTMGPHPTGCWTLDGAWTSQFEQHLRAVLDYPLGQTTARARAVATVRLRSCHPGGMSMDERLHHLFAADPGVRVQLYGARFRVSGTSGRSGPGRDRYGHDIGQVTVLGDDPTDVRTRAALAARWLCDGKGSHD